MCVCVYYPLPDELILLSAFTRNGLSNLYRPLVTVVYRQCKNYIDHNVLQLRLFLWTTLKIFVKSLN